MRPKDHPTLEFCYYKPYLDVPDVSFPSHLVLFFLFFTQARFLYLGNLPSFLLFGNQFRDQSFGLQVVLVK